MSDVIDYRDVDRERRPYFHKVPLIWAAVGALAGATAADLRAGFVAASALALVLAWRRFGPKRSAGSSQSAGRTGALLALLLSFAIGAARGAFWSAKWTRVEGTVSAGPCEVVFLPVTPAAVSALGSEATFRARVFTPAALRGDLAEVTIHARDALKVKEGVPLGATGRFALAEQAMNPGDFDLRRYLSAERTFAAFECSRVEERSASEVPWSARAFPSVIGALRRGVAGSIDRSLPTVEASVLKGIMLGDRSGLPREISLDLRRSGFYRFVTIAGFHVDVVFTLAERSLRRLTRRPTASRLSAVALACLYATLSGWTPGALRAFTCASMRAFAPALRRRYYPLAGLSVAALLTSWAIPFPLTDVGFQLSFLGALGGFTAARYLPQSRRRLRGLALGAARLGVLVLFLFPVTSAGFSDVALAGFALGPLWAAAVSALIPLSVGVLALPLVGRIAGWLPYLVIRGAIAVSSLVSSLPISSVAAPAPGRAEMAAHYGLLLVLAIQGERRLRAKASGPRAGGSFQSLAVLGCCTVLFVSALLRVYVPWPEVTFLCVGQADCALVRYKTTAVLIDTGTPGAFTRSVGRYLRRQGISRIDLCVLSHMHQDHAGGFASLCGEVPVDAVLTSQGTGSEVAALLTASSGLDAISAPPILEAVPGTTYRSGSLLVSAVCPPDQGPSEGRENQRSLVAVFQTLGGGGPLMEFWGDAPKEAVSGYLSRYPALFGEGEQFRVVKVPHHGSRDALAPDFYSRLKGSVAVISVGTNSYGHPSKEVLQAAGGSAVRLYRTDLRGAVTARFLPFGAVVGTFR